MTDLPPGVRMIAEIIAKGGQGTPMVRNQLRANPFDDVLRTLRSEAVSYGDGTAETAWLNASDVLAAIPAETDAAAPFMAACEAYPRLVRRGGFPPNGVEIDGEQMYARVMLQRAWAMSRAMFHSGGVATYLDCAARTVKLPAYDNVIEWRDNVSAYLVRVMSRPRIPYVRQLDDEAEEAELSLFDIGWISGALAEATCHDFVMLWKASPAADAAGTEVASAIGSLTFEYVWAVLWPPPRTVTSRS